MNKIWAALLLGSAALVSAQADEHYKYRLTLTDKGADTSVSHPEALLSERALERRAKQGIAVDSTDLPISTNYLNILSEAGFRPVCTSRWLQTVVVATDDSQAATTLEAIPFVQKAELVWKQSDVAPSFFIETDSISKSKKRTTDSAPALVQYQALAVDKLHAEGYCGEGMHIAVIDAGYLNVDKISVLKNRVLGTYDFVDPTGDIYATHNHGTNTYSVMAYPITSKFAGTAPEASYWLLRSEDSSSEYPVEEDYWIAAAERADSLGVDIISSSLGYFEFDDSAMNHTHADLDGRTAHISRGASIAASKGMLVVVSAGNERQNSWQRISVPADSPDVLTVGACTSTLEPAYFTGIGCVSETLVKPDVAAIGQPAYVIGTNGNVQQNQGTSFSTPAIAGAAACLWQALPHLTARELTDLIRAKGHLAANPDSLLGYGVPDFHKAWRTASPIAEIKSEVVSLVCIDSTANLWRLTGGARTPQNGVLNIFTPSGVKLRRIKVSGNEPFAMEGLQKGIYIANYRSSELRFSQRIHIATP